MLTDTITAVATPPGTGGVGIIRISGQGSTDVLRKVFSYTGEYEHAKMNYGRIVDGAELVDVGYCVVFFAPKSYTGETTAEIQFHGGTVGTARVLDVVLKNGARMAMPGEFTKRAFLNGKLDLTQAEAVSNYIFSVSEASAKLSLRHMQGDLKNELCTIQSVLTDAIAEIEAAVEYPEEDLELEIADKAIPILVSENDKIKKLSQSFFRGQIIKDGLQTVIAGKPNVGKSSLLNSLLGIKRAIVTDRPGTTRDTIEQSFNINGIHINLLDTAGIRSSDDEIEFEGIERSKSAINEAKLVIFVLDSTRDLSEEDYLVYNQLKDIDVEVLFVLNKKDESQRLSEKQIISEFGAKMLISVSAKTGEGMKDLKDLIYSFAVGDETSEQTMAITQLRHKELLDTTSKFIDEAVFALQQNVDMDCVTIDLNSAWNALGQLTGSTAGEEIIDRIFSKFCLGK